MITTTSRVKNNYRSVNLLFKNRETEALPPKKEYQKEIVLKEQTKINKEYELNESINYAKRIQEGMMLKEKHLFRLFSRSFILFKPKDIVSGDFYWFTKIDNKIILAVADCTGHGIPGAFMSVLGISLLNQIVIEEKNTNVSFILQRLNHKLKKAFSYSNESINDEKNLSDGMDIGICCVEYDTMKLTFAGALRPLYIVSKNELNILEGARYPIGGINLETVRTYESKSIDFEEGDKLYFSTDGFADQFGGCKNKKLMAKNFKNMLLKTARFSMQTQHLELERMFKEWKNNYEQTDDVLLIGVQL